MAKQTIVTGITSGPGIRGTELITKWNEGTVTKRFISQSLRYLYKYI